MKKKILIGLIIFVVLILVGVSIYYINDNLNDNKNNQDDIKQQEIKHYADIADTMYSYYKIYYRTIKVPEDKKDISVRVSLGQLGRYGFPIDKFVNFKTNEICDTTLSYALRTVENNKYVIKVYYKCGNVSNYKLTTKTTTTKAS